LDENSHKIARFSLDFAFPASMCGIEGRCHHELGRDDPAKLHSMLRSSSTEVNIFLNAASMINRLAKS
jgi:hypothetical protein